MFCARGKDHFQNCVRSQQQRLEREASSRKVKKAEGHSNVSAILKTAGSPSRLWGSKEGRVEFYQIHL